MLWADNFCIMSNSKKNLETTMNELIVASDGMGLELKPESLWWTTSCAQEDD